VTIATSLRWHIGLGVAAVLKEPKVRFEYGLAVSAAKVQLSKADEAKFSFHVAGVDIERTIKRAEFEKWTAPELAEISGCVDRALSAAMLNEEAIDRVFLTGGTSFVPAVREQFARRFGEAKIETGDQLVSIAYGLALIAGEDDVARWSV
jgi:hypothetical chaperone protein